MSNVSFVRFELRNLILVYDLVSDCCDGDFKIKSKTIKYLPKPNPTDLSDENSKRYDAYLQRAVFYNVTKNTLAGMVGQIFSKESQIELPPELDILEDNCDGKGNGIEQLAKQGINCLFKSGRYGLFSDFPQVDKEMSQDELVELDIRPIIRLYDSRDIINWRVDYVGAEIVYTLIVLREKFTYNYDEFVSTEQNRYRVLKLNENGDYQVDIYESTLQAFDQATQTFTPVSNPVFNIARTFIPTDVDGNTIKRIPFQFCGTESNVADINVPVLYDIATLNIAHYRNSADYEESCYIVGQPTTYVAGLTEEWVKNVLKGAIQLGSRGGLALPVGASAGILQPNPNTMPMEAMKHKEEQFLALGAKLVTPGGAYNTATEAEINTTSETSILATLACNTSECFEKAIENCKLFVKTTGEAIFKLNTDFEIAKLTTAERDQLLKEWQQGSISFTEYRNNLRIGKVQLLDDEKAIKEMAEDEAKNPTDSNIDPATGLPKQPMAQGGDKTQQSVGTDA